MSIEPNSIAPAASADKKRQRGNRGGVRKRMAIAYSEDARHPMPPYLSSANSAMPYPMRGGPYMGMGMGMRPPHPIPLQKFGFFEQRSAVRPGFEKRADAPLRPPGMLGGPMNGRGGPGPGPVPAPVPPPSFVRDRPDPFNDMRRSPPTLAPPSRPYEPLPPEKEPPMMITPQAGAERNGIQNFPPGAEPAPVENPGQTSAGGMNELFAKMVWKKLDMIQSPIRLSRLHTEIMNILQVAIAEESSRS